MAQNVPVKHAARPPLGPPRAMTVAGAVAATAAVAIGTVALLRTPAADEITPVRKMTVDSTTPPFPLSAGDLVWLLGRPPDLGPLADPGRRASCLSGLGYPASAPVLGARPLRAAADTDDADSVILVLEGDDSGRLTAVAVPATCSAADTGLIAETTVRAHANSTPPR